MRNTFITALLCAASILCHAQSSHISGLIQDKSAKPLEAATVSLHKLPDSSLVSATRSAADGSWFFESSRAGKYYIEARMIGYPRVNSAAFVLPDPAGAVHIPAIRLLEKAKALNGVSVTAQRPFIERQADKLVVNVENSIVSSGSTALEVLERTPGITLDKDDHIQLKGKQGVTVMLDGKLTYLTGDQIANLLKNMASDNISRIEVITNPSAKYDAAGNSGIVNIITKKGRRAGLNGTLAINAGKGIGSKLGSELNLNYKTSHFNFFGTYGYSYRTNQFLRYSNSIFSQDPYSANVLVNTDHNRGQHNQYKAGVDINLSKNNTLTFTFSGYTGLFKRVGGGTTNLINRAPGRQDTLRKNIILEHEPYGNATYSTNYRFQLNDKGQELSFDADYARFTDYSLDQNLSTPFTGSPEAAAGPTTAFVNYQPQLIYIKTAKLDYTLPLDSTLKIETGIKGSLVNAPNYYTYDSLSNGQKVSPTRHNDFEYSERILAAYASASKKLGKFSIQGGLRLENTKSSGDLKTTGDVTSRNYTDFFPNLALTEKFSDAHQLAISATRRINRPDYGNINPYRFYLDRNSYFQGNPALKAQYTQLYELSYTFKQKYIATLSYSDIKNPINEFASIDTLNKLMKYTLINYNKQQSCNLTLAIPGDFTPWWTSTNSLEVNYNTYFVQQILTAAKGSASFNLNILENFTLPGNWKAELNFLYRSNAFDGTYHMQGTSSVGAGIQKTFLEKKATVKLNASDIFNTNHFYATSHYNNVNLIIRNKWESRWVNLTFTYRFGGPASDSRKSSGSEELNRAGGKG